MGVRVFSTVVPERVRIPVDRPLAGAEAWAVLEQLRADAYAFAGVDARTPMRRDVVRLVRWEDAGEDDF